MANPLHVQKLKEGVAAWNQWRKENPDTIPDLSKLTVSRDTFQDTLLWNHPSGQVNLMGLDLNHAKLHLVRLVGVNLREASLDRADLLGATLIQADLQKAWLNRASLARSSLHQVKLRESQLEGAIFSNARLEQVDMERANLRNVSWGDARLITVRMTDAMGEHGAFVNCEILDSDLNGADLTYADMSEVRLKGVRLRGSCLRWSRFAMANLDDVVLTDADPESAVLSGATILRSKLRRSHLKGANLQSVTLRRCDLRSADLRDANVGSIGYNRWSYYQGIRVEGCYSSPNFARFAKDQEYIEEMRGAPRDFRYWLFYLPWLISSDCGRSFLLWGGWSVGIALVFALKYWAMGPYHFNLGYLDHSFTSMLYYSVVTFTTLGFGDIVPKSDEAAMWVMLEVAIGYVMLGGLIAIFANKLARRS